MATNRDRFVSPDSTSPGGTGTSRDLSGANRAYASLNEAEAAEQADYVAADVIMRYGCFGTAADTAGVTFTGSTTDATRFILVFGLRDEPNGKHKGLFSTSHYRLVDSSNRITVNDDFFRCDGIQLSVTSTGTFDFGFSLDPSNVDAVHRVSNCIIRGVMSGGADASAGIRFRFASLAATGQAWNNVIYGWANGGSDMQGIITTGSWSTSIYNNTIEGCFHGIHSGNDSMRDIINCAIFNSTDDFHFAGTTTATIDRNASDDGDGTNPVTPSDFNDVFIDVANNDYRLIRTDQQLQNAGAENPSGTLFLDDILGRSRVAPWDIGAFLNRRVAA